MYQKKLVDEFFKVGIPLLMEGLDPWEFKRWLKTIRKTNFYRFIVNKLDDDILGRFADNLENIAKNYFEWQEDKFKDPCDQCFDLPNLKGEILNKAFEGLGVNNDSLQESQFLFNLFFWFKSSLDFLMDNIESWTMTHKFMGEVYEE